MQIILAVRRKGIGLRFVEDIQVIMVLHGDLWGKKGIWGGNGGGRKERRREGGSRERGRRGEGGVGRGVVMQEEEQKGDAKVREPRDQSIQGLCRDSQGKPSTNWK